MSKQVQLCGHVAKIFIYPVKSMRSQSVSCAGIEARGLKGDRFFAVQDQNGALGSGKNTRRFAIMNGLMEFSAERDEDERVFVKALEKRFAAGDPELDKIISGRVGRPVRLVREMQAKSHFDSAPIHLISSADVIRLGNRVGEAPNPKPARANLVIESAAPSRDWVGGTLRIGDDVELDIVQRTERCLMFDWDEFGKASGQKRLRAVAQEEDACFGVYATIRKRGEIAVGAPVYCS